jgi:hypothetical protein
MLRSVDTCGYCQRNDIDVLNGNDAVVVEGNLVIGYAATHICTDCNIILRHAIRVGALALRNELNRQRQLDLFEGPKDRVIRRLLSLEGTDAPATG